jgi:hypothetical protein
MYSLLNILQNYSSNQIQKGVFSFEKEKFKLYKIAISNKILVYPFHKYIEGKLFYSVVNSALNVNEVSWAESFINEYKHLITPDDSGIFLNLSLGSLKFSVKEMDNAKEILNNIKTKKSEVMMVVKLILLKIFYERFLFEEAELMMDSFRHLLKRSERSFSPGIYKGYSNFLYVYSMLIKSKEKEKKDLADKVQLFITKNKAISDYKWIKDKVKELK